MSTRQSVPTTARLWKSGGNEGGAANWACGGNGAGELGGPGCIGGYGAQGGGNGQFMADEGGCGGFGGYGKKKLDMMELFTRRARLVQGVLAAVCCRQGLPTRCVPTYNSISIVTKSKPPRLFLHIKLTDLPHKVDDHSSLHLRSLLFDVKGTRQSVLLRRASITSD